MDQLARRDGKLRRAALPLTLQLTIWTSLFLVVSILVWVGWKPLEISDTFLLLAINKGLSSKWLDAAMLFFSRLGNLPITWLLLISWLGYELWHKDPRGRKAAVCWLSSVLTIAIAFGIADGISGQIVKPLVGRERPEKIVGDLRLVDGGGRTKSFPSSHAANAFAVARVLHDLAPPKSLWWFLAATIALSRVYLGAHFPSDVFGGALLGLSVGTFVLHLRHLLEIVRRKVDRRDGAS